MLKLNSRAFTLIEILIVISVIGILAALTYSNLGPNARNKTYYARSVSEMGTIANGMKLYVAKYNDYPPDSGRGLPSGIQEFVQGAEANEAWPNAPFPGSVYDWENWPSDSIGDQTYQISIRFCEPGQDAVCKANAAKYLKDRVSDDTLNNWTALSSMYYCIKGACRSHQSQPVNYPGFCINCGNSKSQIY